MLIKEKVVPVKPIKKERTDFEDFQVNAENLKTLNERELGHLLRYKQMKAGIVTGEIRKVGEDRFYSFKDLTNEMVAKARDYHGEGANITQDYLTRFRQSKMKEKLKKKNKRLGDKLRLDLEPGVNEEIAGILKNKAKELS